MQKSRRYFYIFILFLLLNPGCEKAQDSVIPSVTFSITINLTFYNQLTIPGNSLFIPNVGYGGVIVYCELPDSYYAYDASCTNEANTTCLVENEGALGTCKCCGSEFVLSGGGYPASGPAKEGLRQYHTSLYNGMLRIYNN